MKRVLTILKNVRLLPGILSTISDAGDGRTVIYETYK